MAVHGARRSLLNVLQEITIPDQRDRRESLKAEGPLLFFIVPGEKTLDGTPIAPHCAGSMVIALLLVFFRLFPFFQLFFCVVSSIAYTRR